MYANSFEDGQKENSMWHLVWKGINFIMAVFFILASVANVNDNDWYLWVPIYLIPALLSLSLAVKPSLTENSIWRTVAVIHFTLCMAYSIYQFVEMLEAIEGKLKNPLEHEEGREMSGLLIIMTWLGIVRFTSFGRPGSSGSNRSLMNALLLMTITLTLLPLFVWMMCFVGDWHKRLGHCKGMFDD